MRKALAVLVLVILMVSAMGPGEGQEDEEGEIIFKETRITDDNSTQVYPSVFGDYIVWTDKRNDNGDIYLHRLSSNSSNRITFNSELQANPSIRDQLIVWYDERDNNLHYYDLSHSKEVNISFINTFFPPEQIKTDNRIIVWTDSRNYDVITHNTDIYMYDLDKNEEFPICTNSARQTTPDIWDNYVIWQDQRNNNSDIYIHDFKHNNEKQITSNTHAQINPRIWGNRVVWLDFRHRTDDNGEMRDIYYYDINTKKEERITNTTTSWGNPVIWGDNIVWARADTDTIFLYNILTTKTYIIDADLATGDISIYENKIVFVDNRNGNLDIYMVEFTLPESPEPTFWEQNRLPIGLGIIFIIVAIILVFLLRGKKRGKTDGNILKIE